jgi:hypothetical protein
LSTELGGFAFISLLRDELEARALCGLLESIARPGSGVTSVFLVPDVRGREFFAAPAHQAEVDRWWGRNVPPTSVPVYLLCHEEGLADWLRGLDGVFIVAASRSWAAEYSSWSVIEAEPAEAPLALAGAAVERFGIADDPSDPSVAGIFDRRDARLVANLRLDAQLAPGPRPHFLPLLHVDGVLADERTSRPRAPGEAIEPIVTETVARQAAQPQARGSRMRTRLPLLLRRSGKPARRSSEDRRLD